MAERRKLPVEHGDHAWLASMEDKISEPEVAMVDGNFIWSGILGWQPFDQTVHGRRVGEFRRLVLAGPASDLPGNKPLGAAEAPQADAVDINAMKVGERRVHRVIHRRALGGRETRKLWIS